MECIEIDASQGEGGGQVVRTSVALSAITGIPVSLDNLRAKRKKPGLMRQHLTAVKAAASICDAELEGAHLGSTALRFSPRAPVTPKEATFKIGTAGSTALVFQTILPGLMCAEGPSTITIEGGTHNDRAPSYDFLKETFLVQLAAMGPRVELECPAHGFYPAGGGRLVATIHPVAREKFKPYRLLERGSSLGRRGVALVSNLPASIGAREVSALCNKMGWAKEECVVEQVKSPGPGNVVYGALMFDHITEVFTAFGRKGKPGERVVDELASEIRGYLVSGAPVGEHLADQLLLPMALGQGGEFLCTKLSLHTTTQAEIISKFIEVDVHTERVDDRVWRVVVEV